MSKSLPTRRDRPFGRLSMGRGCGMEEAGPCREWLVSGSGQALWAQGLPGHRVHDPFLSRT